MASQPGTSPSSDDLLPEADLSCPVCREIFEDPVLLFCSHSFCRACLRRWWTRKGVNECPVCKAVHPRSARAPTNLNLRNLCDSLAQKKRRKIAEANPKDTAENSLGLLRARLADLTAARAACDRMAAHVEEQARDVEAAIAESLAELVRFLREEQEARTVALREEEEQKSRATREMAEALDGDIAAVSDAIRAAEEGAAERVAEICKAAMAAVRNPRKDPPLLGALIDEAKHLGNLAFRVWDKMKDLVSYTPVILDPNSAHADYTLSDGLTTVRHGERQERLPANPERFDYYRHAAGAEGFSSGLHNWVVEVGDCAKWEVGVSTLRGEGSGGVSGRCWSVCFDGVEYAAFSSPDSVMDLQLSMPDERPRKIAVELDWDGGRLSFYGRDVQTHLHSFRHAFSDPVFPYVLNGDDGGRALRVLPRPIRVNTDEACPHFDRNA